MQTSVVSTGGASTGGAAPRPTRASVVTTAVVTAIVATPPLVAVTGLLYRFPVPFAGYMSGWEALRATPVVLFFYGVMLGGFLVQGGLAALVALCVRIWMGHSEDAGDAFAGGVAAGLASAAVGVALLANWDLIYGPW